MNEGIRLDRQLGPRSVKQIDAIDATALLDAISYGGREGSQATEKVIDHEGRSEHGWIPGGKEGRK